MDKGVKIPWIGRRYTMGRGSKYGWGSKFHGLVGQNTMGRGFKIPWIVDTI